jgi:hypothetical protein
VSERRPMRRAFKSVTVSMRCGSERPSRSNFHTTRTSPAAHKAHQMIAEIERQ